jgi:hypothetical protein
MKTLALTHPGTMSDLWEKKWVRVVAQVLLITAFSAFTAIAKKMHPSIGVPGSSAVYWLTVMVIGRSVTRWDGAGFLTGAGVGVWGLAVGLEHSFVYDLALYSTTGLLLDIMARVPKIDIRHPVGAAISALVAHMAKFGFIVASAMLSSLTTHFMVVGLVNSALLHAGFGIAAGVFGWSIFKGGQLAFKRWLS